MTFVTDLFNISEFFHRARADILNLLLHLAHGRFGSALTAPLS
jgi:hypothetical protein